MVVNRSSQRAGPPGAVDADQHAGAGREQHGGRGQPQRRGEPLQQVAQDGPAGDVRGAQVAVRDAAHIVGELRREGVVQVQLRAQPRDGRRVGPLAHHRLHRIARGHVEQQKGYHQHAEQCRHYQEQPAEQKTRHWRKCTPVQRWPLKMAGISQPVTSGRSAHISTGK